MSIPVWASPSVSSHRLSPALQVGTVLYSPVSNPEAIRVFVGKNQRQAIPSDKFSVKGLSG